MHALSSVHAAMPGLPETQLRASLPASLQTARAHFNTHSYSSGSSQAGSTMEESGMCKVFYTQQGHCGWRNACHTTGARIVCSSFVPPFQGCGQYLTITTSDNL